MNEPTPDYYTLLGIDRNAHSDDVRKAFHRFARAYHPDNFGSEGDDARSRATALYRLGTEAYRVLLDPSRRTLYDEGLSRGETRYQPDRAAELRRTQPGRRKQMLKSSKARNFYGTAKKAMQSQDWVKAKLNLQLALQHESDSDLLKTLLAEVRGHLGKS